jgi:hypothetical protein
MINRSSNTFIWFRSIFHSTLFQDHRASRLGSLHPHPAGTRAENLLRAGPEDQTRIVLNKTKQNSDLLEASKIRKLNQNSIKQKKIQILVNLKLCNFEN